jgi:hypothetical protein
VLPRKAQTTDSKKAHRSVARGEGGAGLAPCMHEKLTNAPCIRVTHGLVGISVTTVRYSSKNISSVMSTGAKMGGGGPPGEYGRLSEAIADIMLRPAPSQQPYLDVCARRGSMLPVADDPSLYV